MAGRVSPGARWRPVLRLAARDAVRHRLRTTLATLLVALPVAGLVGYTALTGSAVPTRERALATIPDGVQAVVTATALTRPASPFPQVPEGAPGPWMDDMSQLPATGEELAALLPSGDRLLQYWNSPELIATTGIALAPGEQAEAGAGTAEQLGPEAVGIATLTEASPEALALLLPALAAGAAPGDASGAVVTSGLAGRLRVAPGDSFTLVAPPFNGWYSMDGRIGEVMADSQRGFRVAGVVEDSAPRVWALEGWISAMAAADPPGVDGHWLAVGPEPVTWDQARAVNDLQAFAVSRHVLENYPLASQLYPRAVDVRALAQRVFAVVVAGVLGGALVLFLVTPAFAVSVDQSRRTLGLAAATGAAPRDLRRMVMTQGLVVGLAGGALGAALGGCGAVAVGRWLLPDQDILGRFPWWILPTGIALAAVLGMVAAAFPARTASRLPVVDALKDRPARGAHTGAVPVAGVAPATLRRVLGGARAGAAAGPGGARRAMRSALGAASGAPGLTGTGPVDAGPRRAAKKVRDGIRAGVATAMGCAAALVGAVGAGAWALSLPLPAAPVDAAEGAPPLMTLLLLVTLACAGTALALAVRAIPNLAARAAGRLPLAPRLAFRDAADHRSRFLPAVAAVLVSVGVASYAAVLAGSGAANDANQRGQLVAPGHLAVGPQVQVSDAFDRMVLLDALQGVAQEVPVTGTEPFYMVRFDAPEAQAGGAEATEEGNESGAGAEGRGESNGVQDARRSAAQGEEEVYGDHFRPVQPADRTCPEGLYPDTGSGIEVGAPLNCVGYDQAFHPSLMTAGLTNGEVYALTGDALRASGLDGAEAAAQVLDAGGVVVRNAAQLSGNGTVRLAIAADPLPDEQNADRFVELPGAFLRGFTPVAAVSPETARDLGFPGLRYIGEYLVTSRPLSHAEVALAKRLIQERSPLAAVATRYLPYPWGDSWALAPIVLLAALAVAATAISLALAKTQSRRDMATMHAVGATGAFLRRFTAAQAGAVLAAGAPLGVAAGIALGAYQVAWNRRTGVGGAWLDTVPLWGLQGGIVLGVVAAAAVATVLLGRPPLRLTRRRID